MLTDDHPCPSLLIVASDSRWDVPFHRSVEQTHLSHHRLTLPDWVVLGSPQSRGEGYGPTFSRHDGLRQGELGTTPCVRTRPGCGAEQARPGLVRNTESLLGWQAGRAEPSFLLHRTRQRKKKAKKNLESPPV